MMLNDPMKMKSINQVPDGGYGLAIVASAFLTHALLNVANIVFSQLLPQLSSSLDQPLNVVGWIRSFSSFGSNLVGILAGSLVDVYGYRAVCVCAGLFQVIGYFGSSFATEIYVLYFTYGILGGIGHGMMHVGTAVAVQRYFTRRRTLAAGLSYIGASVGIMISSPCFQLIFSAYGWRGALLLSSAIHLHLIPCGLIFKPLAISPIKIPGQLMGNGTEEEQQKVRQSVDTKCHKIRSSQVWRNFRDISIFRELDFLLIVSCVTLMRFCYYTYSSFLYSNAISKGISPTSASLLYSVNSFCALGSRFVSSFVANLDCVNVSAFYSLSILFAGVVLFLLPLAGSDFYAFAALMGLYGVAEGGFYTVQTTNYSHLFGVERVAKCIGWIRAISGILNIGSVPLAGLIVDRTKNYDLVTTVAGIVALTAGTLAFIPFFRRRRRQEFNGEIIDLEMRNF